MNKLHKSLLIEKLEHSDSTLYKGERLSTKKGVLGTKINCIGWCGFNSGALVSVEYFFNIIISRPTLHGVVVPVKVPFMD